MHLIGSARPPGERAVEDELPHALRMPHGVRDRSRPALRDAEKIELLGLAASTTVSRSVTQSAKVILSTSRSDRPVPRSFVVSQNN